jgi:hypothetical protein
MTLAHKKLEHVKEEELFMWIKLKLSDYMALRMSATNNPLVELIFPQIVEAARNQGGNVLVVDDLDGSALFSLGAQSMPDGRQPSQGD